MNPIAICLDLLLISLLLLAVWIGFRLETRLKALRGSQEGFVGAVAELNAGVEKAQRGLAELKSATLEARNELADRIQDAKGMTARLERQTAAAEQASQRLEEFIERASQLRPPPLARVRDEGRGVEPPAIRPTTLARPSSFGSIAAHPSAEEELVLRPAALSRPVEPARSRARLDDDLFDAPLTLGGVRR